MTVKTKAQCFQSNPIKCVHMFQLHIETFFSEYIFSVENTLGKVTDHLIKLEFQTGGSPHAHCLLLVDGAQRVDIDSDEDVCALIDTYISFIISDDTPENKEVINHSLHLQMFIHSQYCHCNGRYGFLRLPSPQTLLTRELESDAVGVKVALTSSITILAKVYAAVEENTDDEIAIKKILHTAVVSIDEYIKNLKTMKRGTSVV